MFNDCSVEYVAEVVIVKQLLVLLVGNAEAFKHIVNIGFAEQGAVLEAGQVGVNVVMVFDCLNNVTLAVKFEQFLSDQSVTVVKGNVEVGQVAIRSVEVGRVTEGTLVVWNGPGWGRHDAKVVVPVGDH